MTTQEQQYNNMGFEFINMIGEALNTIKGSQQQLIKANQNIADNFELHSREISMHNNQIKDLLRKDTDNKNRLDNVEFEIKNIKENDRIYPDQIKAIKNKIFKRIIKFLEPQSEDYPKYNKAYFGSIYGYLRKECRLGSPISLTTKKNYDDIMKGIEVWSPPTDIREKADKRALNRLKAKRLGY